MEWEAITDRCLGSCFVILPYTWNAYSCSCHTHPRGKKDRTRSRPYLSFWMLSSRRARHRHPEALLWGRRRGGEAWWRHLIFIFHALFSGWVTYSFFTLDFRDHYQGPRHWWLVTLMMTITEQKKQTSTLFHVKPPSLSLTGLYLSLSLSTCHSTAQNKLTFVISSMLDNVTMALR